MGSIRRLTLNLLRRIPSSKSFIRRKSQEISSTIADRYFKQCYNYLKQCGADLVHVLTPDPSSMVMIRAAYEAGIPVLYQELGTPYHPPDFEAFYEHFTSVLPLCSEVAALSPLLAKEWRDKLPHSNSLSVLPIMADGLMNGNGSAKRVRLSHEIAFGFAARIEHLKGPMVLIDAFAAAHNKFPNIELKIAGSGSQKRSAIVRARELGINNICDFRGVYTRPEQKSAFMKSLDVFVLPSRTEGTPNCIVEAMAHGLPIIASAVGGIPDIVTAETGILVSPGDAAALSDAICRLAGDPSLRTQMGRNGLERYKKLFSPGVVMPMMLNTYKRVAKRNGSNHLVESELNGYAHPWLEAYNVSV
jgi:glycosyltransferase involved in cell wall biosynthesis